MREIIFRGKRIDNGEWVQGFVLDDDLIESKKMFIGGIVIENGIVIGHGFDEVIPETIGQYTGLTDKNGTKVFEGDILVFCKGATYPYKVTWDGMGWKLIRSDGKRIKEKFECNEIHYVNISEIIGNIHDNPELLKESDNNV